LHEGVTADLHSLSLRCFNSLFFAASEVLGRSYGGGVLEIEPNEADHLPLIGNVADKDAHAARDEVSKLLKLGESEKAIEAADTFLLHDVLGLSKRDIKKLNQFWRTLMTRRIDRK